MLLTAAKLQDLLMERFYTAVRQNESSVTIKLIYQSYPNTAVVRHKNGPKGHIFLSVLKWTYTAPTLFAATLNLHRLLLYLIGRWGQRTMGRNQHSSNAFHLFPTQAWEESVNSSQLCLNVMPEKLSPLTTSCYQKATLKGLLRNICSYTGSMSSSSLAW